MPSVFGILLVIDFESSLISSVWSFVWLVFIGRAGFSGFSLVVIGLGGTGGGGDDWCDVTTLDSIEHSTKVYGVFIITVAYIIPLG